MKTLKAFLSFFVSFFINSFSIEAQKKSISIIDSLKMSENIDSTFNKFWAGNYKTPTTQIAKSISNLDALLGQSNKSSNELLAKRAILAGFKIYIELRYEYSLKMPMSKQIQLVENQLKEVKKLEGIELNEKSNSSLNIINSLLLHILKKYEDAKKYSLKSVKAFPNWAFANCILGDNYYYTGDYIKAQEQFELAIKFDNNLIESYYLLGWLLSDLNDLDGAIKMANNAKEIDPEYFLIYNLYSKIYGQLNDKENEVNYAEKVLSLNPNFTYGYGNLSYVYSSQKKYAKALECAKLGIKNNPYNAENYRRLGNTNEYMGKKDTAIIVYQNCIRVDSSFSNCYDDLGEIYERNGNKELALEYFNKSIKINSFSPYAYAHIGRIYYNDKKYISALPFYEKAFALKPSEGHYSEMLASIYSQLNRNVYDRIISAEYYEKTILLNPTNKKNLALSGYEFSAIANHFVEKDSIPTAIEWLKKGAKLGSSSSRDLALALMYENGIEVEKNYDLALKYYQKRAEKIYGLNMCLNGICRLYENGYVKMDSSNYALWKGINDTKLKKFKIPCQYKSGGKIDLDIYIYNDYPPNIHPMAWEAQRIDEEFDAIISQDVIESFYKLYILAKNNKVSFIELCEYALKAATDDNSKDSYSYQKAEIQKEKNITKIATLYKNFAILNDNKIKNDSTNKSLKNKIPEYYHGISNFYVDYSQFLYEQNQEKEAIGALEKATSLESENKRIVSQIEKIKNKSLILESKNIAFLKLAFTKSLQTKDSVNTQNIVKRIFFIEDTPSVRDDIRSIYLNETLDGHFEELFLNDRNNIKIYRDYFIEKISKFSGLKTENMEQEVGLNILKRVNYSNIVLLDEEYFKSDSSNIVKKQISQHYNSLVWYCILTKRFSRLGIYISRGIELDENNLYLLSNFPHVLLFRDKFDEAKELYFKLKDLPFDKDSGYPTFKEAFLSDFKDFEKFGVTHEKLNEIKELLMK